MVPLPGGPNPDVSRDVMPVSDPTIGSSGVQGDSADCRDLLAGSGIDLDATQEPT